MGASTSDRRVAWPPRSVAARMWVAMALVVFSVSCSGDDDTTPTSASDSPSQATRIVATTVALTTLLTTTTMPPTVVPTSDAPNTTVAPTVPGSTATSPQPASTSAPSSAAAMGDEQEVLALIDGYYVALRECARSVPTCDSAVFDAYLTNPQLDSRRQTVAEWQASYYEALNVDSLTYEVLETHLDGDLPYVLICERDGSSLVQRRPGEAEVVVEQGYHEKIREVQLERVVGEWRIRAYATREDVAGLVGALCS